MERTVLELDRTELETLNDALQTAAITHLRNGGHWTSKSYRANREVFNKVWLALNEREEG